MQQYTIVFIIILITIDLMCFFLIPVSWIYTFGSAYVWLYFFRHTDQGLCFLTLSLCFVFIYFEFSLYSKATKFTHSIYVFRPFAAHSIGYSVVCVGFSLKRYLDISYRDFKRMNVRRQNYLHFRILYEALPLSSVNDNAYVQHSLDYFQKDSLEVHEVAMSDDFSSDFYSRSVFIPFRFGQLCFGRLVRWFFGYLRSVDKQYLDFDRYALPVLSHWYFKIPYYKLYALLELRNVFQLVYLKLFIKYSWNNNAYYSLDLTF
ncbi:unnamed protein product [Schistosoma guineensis]|nr:unnamed protein product [Schistosoma guineensis]